MFRVLSCGLLTLLLLAAAPAAASEKIAILRFQASPGVDDEVRSQVEGHVTQALVDERRFEILDRSPLDALMAERFLQQAMAPEEQTQIAESGARWLVLGDVNQSSVHANRLDSGDLAYRAVVAFRLRIIDVASGELSYSQQFTSSRGSFGDALQGMFRDTTSPGGARQAALKQTEKALAQFIDRAFPIEAQVLAVEKRGRKGEALEVLLDRGPADGISRKTALVVVQRSQIQAGERLLTRDRELAQLEVVRSEGDHLSVARVRKGGQELAAAVDRQEVIHVQVR